MYADYLAQTPLMEWNTHLKSWQYSTGGQLFELWEPYLETWPISGITQNGKVYALPTPGHHILALGSSLSPNLPTPTVSNTFTDNLKSTQQKDGSLHSVTLAQVVTRPDLLPTPTVGHLRNHDEDVDKYLERKQKGIDGEYNGIPGVSLGVAVRMEMLPTPMTTDYKQTNCAGNWNRNSPPLSTIVHSQDWGRFEPAIRRWEQVTGRPAPAPTIADGPNGQHRLSALFAEWLMGLKQGHLTGLGLTRKDELKMCGNGVVPAQAALALSLLDPEPTL